jgi:hypothetical protein
MLMYKNDREHTGTIKDLQLIARKTVRFRRKTVLHGVTNLSLLPKTFTKCLGLALAMLKNRIFDKDIFNSKH